MLQRLQPLTEELPATGLLKVECCLAQHTCLALTTLNYAFSNRAGYPLHLVDLHKYRTGTAQFSSTEEIRTPRFHHLEHHPVRYSAL